MSEAVDTLPESPAEEVALPSILYDENDAANAAALLGEEETTETQPEEAEAEATDDAEPTDPIDKPLQLAQQRQSQREKRTDETLLQVVQAQKELAEAIKALRQNPTAANKEAVAEQVQVSVMAQARADVAKIQADPAFDPYKDQGKINAIMFEALEKVESQTTTLRSKTAESEKTRELERVNQERHDKWWTNFATKNPAIGRTRGEELWAQADAAAIAEQARMENGGITITALEAAKQVFVRLVAAEKKKPAPAGKGPARSGGQLGPVGGRAGSTPARVRTLEDDVKDGKYNLAGSM